MLNEHHLPQLSVEGITVLGGQMTTLPGEPAGDGDGHEDSACITAIASPGEAEKRIKTESTEDSHLSRPRSVRFEQTSIAVTGSETSGRISPGSSTFLYPDRLEVPKVQSGSVASFSELYPSRYSKIPDGDPNSKERYKATDFFQYPPRDRGRENHELQALLDSMAHERLNPIGFRYVDGSIEALLRPAALQYREGEERFIRD